MLQSQNKTFFKKLLFSTLLLLMPTITFGKNKAIAQQGIILLHGLSNNIKSFSKMQQELEKAFPLAQVIALTGSEGFNSIAVSIEDQATTAFLELQEKINDLANTSILLVGQSQGGARAYSLFKKYADSLNIKGIITLGTPWEGAPGARVTRKILKEELTQDVKDELRLLSKSLGYPPEKLEINLGIGVQQNEAMCTFPGAKDLIIGSEFLKQVAKNLPNIEVPILAIASGQSNFEELSDNNKELKGKLKSLNKLYTWFTVGTHLNHKHDTMVPVYSQHALSIIKNSKNFQRYYVGSAFHSANVLGIPVPDHKDALKNPLIIEKIIEFTKSKLERE